MKRLLLLLFLVGTDRLTGCKDLTEGAYRVEPRCAGATFRLNR